MSSDAEGNESKLPYRELRKESCYQENEKKVWLRFNSYFRFKIKTKWFATPQRDHCC